MIVDLITMIKVMQSNDWSDNNLGGDFFCLLHSSHESGNGEKERAREKNETKKPTAMATTAAATQWNDYLDEWAESCTQWVYMEFEWKIKPTILCVFIILKSRIYTKLNHKKKHYAIWNKKDIIRNENKAVIIFENWWTGEHCAALPLAW